MALMTSSENKRKGKLISFILFNIFLYRVNDNLSCNKLSPTSQLQPPMTSQLQPPPMTSHNMTSSQHSVLRNPALTATEQLVYFGAQQFPVIGGQVCLQIELIISKLKRLFYAEI